MVGPEEIAAASDVLARNFVGYGPKAKELEATIAGASGRRYAFAVASGFHALALAVRALDLPRNSLIALPVLTCPSVLAAVTGAGHRAGLTDIEDSLLTIDPRTIPRDAAAVIAPHAYGAPVDVEVLKRLACPWIEDCASSPSMGPGARPAGASGTFAVFSFGSTKYLTGGSGGMLLTDDQRLATRVEDLLDFDRFQKRGTWQHGLPAALPGRLADLNAAVALTQWRRLPDLATHRQTIAAVYRAGLGDVAGLRVPPPGISHAFYRYIARTDAPSEPLAVALQARDIDARSSVNPWLDEAPNVTGGSWPVAAGWRGHLLSLPIHPQVSEADAHRVVATLKGVLAA